MHPGIVSKDWFTADIAYLDDTDELYSWVMENKTGEFMRFSVMDTSEIGMSFQYRFEKEADAVAFKLRFKTTEIK